MQEFEILFEDFGGFDGLYLKMLAAGIPTAVHLMWIPFSELDIRQQLLLTLRLSNNCLIGLWKTRPVSYVREWIFEKIRNVNDDIMTVIVFPLVELLIPFPVRIYASVNEDIILQVEKKMHDPKSFFFILILDASYFQVRMQLGMAWPEEVGQTVGSTWYLKWQSEAEMNFKSRKTDGIRWFFWFFIRSIAYGYVLFHVLRFMKRKVPRLLGYGPFRRNPNMRKLRRVVL